MNVFSKKKLFNSIDIDNLIREIESILFSKLNGEDDVFVIDSNGKPVLRIADAKNVTKKSGQMIYISDVLFESISSQRNLIATLLKTREGSQSFQGAFSMNWEKVEQFMSNAETPFFVCLVINRNTKELTIIKSSLDMKKVTRYSREDIKNLIKKELEK
jgi:hypothetical protein